MTIAACYVCSEGVVFGADSTATFLGDKPLESNEFQTFDFTQKIFEIGEAGSTLGFVSSGIQGIQKTSLRTMLADLSVNLIQFPPASVADAMNQWRDKFWSAYSTAFAYEIQRVKVLLAKADRSKEDDGELLGIRQNLSGSCTIGGRVAADRTPAASCFTYGPFEDLPECSLIPSGWPRFWGCPNLLERMQFGIEENLIRQILASPHWKGSEEDLHSIVREQMLQIPRQLPIRDAIDWVYSSIFTTIKGMKFARQPPVCGGPIEVAVITTDRPFRWVCHKSLADAITVPGSTELWN
jgi:hypothetical protein